MNQNNNICCKVENCVYHATGDQGTASKIEVGNCEGCCSSADTFCKTYKEQ